MNHRGLHIYTLFGLILGFSLMGTFRVNAQEYAAIFDYQGSTQIQAKLWTKKDGLQTWSIHGIFEDSRGLVWIQDGLNLLQFDGQSLDLKLAKAAEMYAGTSTMLGEDQRGAIWRYRTFKNPGDKNALDRIRIYDPGLNQDFSIAEYVPAADLPSYLSPKTVLFSVNEVIYLSDPQTGRLWQFNHRLDLLFEAPEYLQSKEITYLPGSGGKYWGIETLPGYPGRKKVYLIGPEKRVLKTYPIDPYHELFLDQYQQLWSFNVSSLVYDDDSSNEPVPMPILLGSNETNFTQQALQGPIIPQYTHRGRHYYQSINHPDLKPTEVGFFPGTIGIGRLADQSFTYHWWKPGQIKSSKSGGTLPPDLLRVLSEKIPGLNEPFTRDYVPSRQLKDGNLLIALPKGLLQVSFSKKHFENIFPNKNVRGLELLDQQRLVATYIENQKNYLIEADLLQKKQRLLSPEQRDQNTYIYSITNQGDSIWLGLVNGSLELYDQDWQFLARYPSPGNKTYIENKSLHFPTDSTVWMATNEGLIEVNHQSGNTHFLPQLEEPTHLIYQDRTGACWIGTNRGLYHWESGQHYLDTLPDGSHIPVSHLFEDEQGTFWIASPAGLFKWQPFSSTYEHFDRKDGLPHNTVHAVYPDSYGRLWLSTNYGIAAFDTLNYLTQTYTEADGLLNREQNFQSHIRASDGQLFFGGIAGVTAFYPDQVPFETGGTPYEISIRNIELYDKKGYAFDTLRVLNSGELNLRIPRAVKHLKITFEYPNYTTMHPQLSWSLQEIEHWNDLDNSREFIITNLKYGDTKLIFSSQVEGRDRQLQTTMIAFYRPYPIYYKVWFWIIAGVLTLLLFWSLAGYRSTLTKRRNKLLKQAVRRKTQEIADQAKELKILNHTKNELFKKISHELRTPLSLLYLNTEALNQSALAAPERKLARRMQDQVNHLTVLIDSILSLGDDNMLHHQSQKQVVEWNGFLRKSFAIFEELAAKQQIHYQLQVASAQEWYIMLDKIKMEQILNNLITNALKFTPKGGRVTVQSIPKEDQLQIVVSDTGVGIRLEEQASIFEAYFQSDETKADSREGLGLGLSICRENVKLMGGEIWVESIYGKGSQFYVQIPVETAPASLSSAAATDQEQTKSKVPAGAEPNDTLPHILIVEDNAALRAELERLLADQYEIRTATNGKMAFDLLSSAAPAFDLIISDIMMPVMDGFELLQKIKASPELNLTPFLFLTALGGSETKLESLRWGVDAFMTKPFSREELLTRVNNLVKNQLARREADVREASLPALEANAGEQINHYQTEWLNELQELVEKEFSKPKLKITDIAFQLNISERTFRNRLKEYTGMTPSAYLQQVRLQYALLYLEQQKYRTVSEVSYAVGFKDPRYFSKIFQQAFGKRPSDYLSD